jgi:hypothetical protein
MKYGFVIMGFAIFIFSCHIVENKDETKRIHPFASKFEDTVKLPIKKKFAKFSYFNMDNGEYFSYLIGNHIYVLDLGNKTVEDSIDVSLDSAATRKYGIVRSFCFSGKDSLFVLFDQAIFFWIKKNVHKIIPINRLDTLQYPTFRFQDLEDVPIYYDKTAQAIVGEVYCSDCWMTEPAFYRQKLIGRVSVETAKLKLFNISYPQKYIKDYYGYDMKPYGQSIDSITLVSFPCDDSVSVLNRNTDSTLQFPARSIYQTNEPQPLIPLSDSGSVEQKMRHMTVQPYYSEIKFDKARKLYYRFFRKAIPLKNKDGTYNDFFHKGLVLMVFNSEYKEIGEYELPRYYNSFVSFVGKSGLYVIDLSPNALNKNVTVFHVLTFK